MGEYAEMMLDGTCCCSCGEFLDGEANGFPDYCNDCKPDTLQKIKAPNIKLRKNVPCTHAGCNRKFVDAGAVLQHVRQFHGRNNSIK